ncbi:hypothetical protein [Bifidobacterium parmae]|uniref:MSI60-related protein n=1 Tax=Bifidobacterium parmae TaxID=361854 RepID=A0A2N5J6F3_9BIFI|nr:hypothetical protein [Bifidobacterium parmae]PLS29800.1 MSI60-related protein [Bifidobacterium parmae]
MTAAIDATRTTTTRVTARVAERDTKHAAARVAAGVIAMIVAAAMLFTPMIASASGPLSLKVIGNIDFRKYEKVSIRQWSRDGSVAIVRASDSSDDGTYFMVTPKDASITKLDDSNDDYPVISTDAKHVYYIDDDQSVRMVDVASKKITTLNYMDDDSAGSSSSDDDSDYSDDDSDYSDDDSDYSDDDSDDSDDAPSVWHANGNRLVVAYSDHYGVGDIARHKMLSTLKVDEDGASTMAMNSDLSHLYVLNIPSGASSSTLKTYDAGSGDVVSTMQAAIPEDSVPSSFDPDSGTTSFLFGGFGGGTLLAYIYYFGDVTGPDGPYVYRIDSKTGDVTTISNHRNSLVTANLDYVMLAEDESGDVNQQLSVYEVKGRNAVSSLIVKSITTGKTIHSVTDRDTIRKILKPFADPDEYPDGNTPAYLSSDGRYLVEATTSSLKRSEFSLLDTVSGALSTVTPPESDTIALGDDGIDSLALSTDSGTMLAVTGIKDKQSGESSYGRRIVVYDTGIGGDAWTRPKTWIMVGIGAAVAVAAIVIVIIVARRSRRRRRATAGGAGTGMPPLPVAAAQPATTGHPMPLTPAPQAVRTGLAVPQPPVPSVPQAWPSVPSAPRPTAPLPPVAGQPTQPERPRFCPRCGAPVAGGDTRFCTRCGRELFSS